MFFRKTRTSTTQVIQLVHAYRDAEGRPRQRVLLSLGNAALPKHLWHAVAKAVEDRLHGQASLFEAETPPEVAAWVDTIVRRLEAKAVHAPAQAEPTRSQMPNNAAGPHAEKNVSAQTANAADPKSSSSPVLDGVLLEAVEHRDHAVLGPALAGLHAWNALGIPEILACLGFNRVERNLAAIEVLNRLTDPVSENALPSWFRRSALPELLGAESLPLFRDRFYRSCDLLLKHKDAIFAHIRRKEKERFRLKRTVLLYDLTNTYFEGAMLRNPKAKRGKSKEKRDDCPQVVVGMVFDEEGFEMGHEVFEGNRNDGKSLIDMVKHLRAAVGKEEGLFAAKRPLVIVDSGIATAENRKLFTAEGFDFLANDSRTGRKKYAAWFRENTAFTAIPDREGRSEVLVRRLKDPLAEDPEQADTLILCKSEGRREKEDAILSQAEQRFLEAIARLRARIEKGRGTKREALERAVGRMLAKHPRVARYYHIELVETTGAPFVLRCERKQDAYEEAGELHGCYVLRTNQADPGADAAELWHLYMILTRAEDGFRALKSDVGLRPNRHHRQDRVDSHVLISVLAYHLLHWITYTLRKQGDTRSWATIRRILSTHAYATICLFTRDGARYRIRKAGLPDEEQKRIYQSLGISWKGLPASRTAG